MPDHVALLDRVSPLASCLPVTLKSPEHPVALKVSEQSLAALLEINAWPGQTEAAARYLAEFVGLPEGPLRPGACRMSDEFRLMRLGPRKFQLIANDKALNPTDLALPASLGTVTDQTHSRLCLRLTGPACAALLSRGLSCDLREKAFPKGTALTTPLHEVPVILLRHTVQDHDLFLPRSFAVSLWEMLCEFARSLGLTPTE